MTGAPDPATDPRPAAAHLDVLDADQAALADHIVQPWSWDAASGLLPSGFLSSWSAHDVRVVRTALVRYGAGIAGLVALLGSWLSQVYTAGLRAGR